MIIDPFSCFHSFSRTLCQLRDQLLSMWKSSGVDVIHDLLLEPPSLADTHPDELFVREKVIKKYKLLPKKL